MFKNYLKIAFRNLIKQKGYTIINVLGLAIGMAACVVMLIFVQDELSYDQFHEKSDRLFRVTDLWDSGELKEDLSTAPWPVTRVLQIEHPDVIEKVVRLYRPSSWGNAPVIRYQDQSFSEPGVMFGDSTFFQMFDFEFVRGSAETVFKDPNSVVITEETAKRYFGDENPIGQRLTLNNQLEMEVTGVLRDLPQNSHIKFDFLTTARALKNWWGGDGFERNWIWQSAWSYMLLSSPGAAANLQQQLPDFVQRHFPESVRDGSSLTLQNITDIHLKSQRFLEIEANGNIIYVYIFSAIAMMILLIACINFMNLATARSAQRAKEVGMRKVMGAYRNHLVMQFLGESIILSFISLFLAIALIELALPLFNSLTGKSLEILYFDNWMIITSLISIGLMVGIISGSYPALFLSGFRPIAVLKGSLSAASSISGGGSMLRKVLVISQFTVSLVLLISISLINDQLDYLRNKDLGYNKEEVLYINMVGDIWNQQQAFTNEVLKNNDVLAISRIGSSIPGAADGIANSFVTEGMSVDKPKWIGTLSATYNIADVLGLEFIEGRQFSLDFPTDSSAAFIVNEAAVRDFGWEGSALGKKLQRIRTDGSVIGDGQVIGVVKDFHYQPLHETLKPLVIRFGGGQYAVRISGSNIPQTIDYLRDTWHTFSPDWPFNFRFLDEDLNKLYSKEEKLGQVIRYFTVLAIFIACLGLFGLASFTAERRTKEIGVRKTLGASIPSLVMLLSKEFTKLVALAFLIAVPIAYFAIDTWLQNFAYRTDIGVVTFILTGSVALLIALFTVSYQTIRAALANPVDALKYE